MYANNCAEKLTTASSCGHYGLIVPYHCPHITDEKAEPPPPIKVQLVLEFNFDMLGLEPNCHHGQVLFYQSGHEWKYYELNMSPTQW